MRLEIKTCAGEFERLLVLLQHCPKTIALARRLGDTLVLVRLRLADRVACRAARFRDQVVLVSADFVAPVVFDVMLTTERRKLIGQAFRLEWMTVAWMIVEAVVRLPPVSLPAALRCSLLDLIA